MLQALAVAAFVVGAVMLAIFGFLWRGKAARSALASRLVEVDGLLQDIGYRKIRRQNDIGHYWVIYAAYEYSVGGQHFQGSRTSLDTDIFASEEAVATVIGDRKAGDKATVWYDPASPARSALQRLAPTDSGFYPIGAIGGGVIAVAGVILAYLAR
jgi:hypothetical protein